MAETVRPVPLQVVGLSHLTAPVGVRETLAFDPGEAAAFLGRGLRDEAWTEAMLLSTCNRTELYAAPGPAAARDGGIAARLAGARPWIATDVDGSLYGSEGTGAVRHLVRVACGLESMILGESEILAQVQEAHRIAREAGTAGPVLDRVVPAALRISRKAREETGIHRGVTSVPAAALALARRHFGDFSRIRVLVLGAGEAGRIGARLFASERPRALWVTNRTPSRAVAVAAESHAATWSWHCLEGALDDVDVVLCAVRVPEPVLSFEALRAAARRRAGRTLVLLDIGVPRNVDPRARDLEGVFLHDVDALERLVEQNREKRRAEVEKVEALIDEGLTRILLGEERRAAEPLVAEIRKSLEELRLREIERSQRHFTPEQKEHLDRLTRSLLDKAFHAPMQSLREMGTDAKGRESWLRRFFGLRPRDGGPPGGGGGTGA
jgi:glutamyl-tRNA reductase